MAAVQEWEADVATSDGGSVHVRPIRPDDAPRIVAFHARQSPESIYFRYFSPRPRLSPAEVRHFTHVDGRDRVAFVALLDDDIVGVGRYDRYPATDEAEVAFFIDDDNHGRGLATILLEYLAAAGRANGVTAFMATVLSGNRKMLGVFKQAGFETATRFADGVIEVRFPIAPTDASLAAVEARALRAEASTVARLLEPRSVAVIGAGRTAGTVGHDVLRSLLAHEFAGAVYPVNREALAVAGVRAWPSVLDVGEHVDLAVVAVPAEEVLDAVEECARARVGAIAVVSAGFADAGREGVERERALVGLARRHGIRLLGPASLGVVNTDPEVRLHATFAPLVIDPGPVALCLQAGTIGIGLAQHARRLGLGFSNFVAVGNKADVSGNDLLAWWEGDERTHVVCLSLESFGNPRRFRRVAPRVARAKPIVAMVRGADPSDQLLLAQTGVVRVDSLDELLDTARVLAWQPLPKGRRVVVVADAPGTAAFAVDACATAGLDPVEPIVIGLGADVAAHRRALDAAVGDPAVDAVLVVHAAPIGAAAEDVAAAIAAAAAAAERAVAVPVVACLPASDVGRIDGPAPRPVPVIRFPERAARALAAAAEYEAWRSRPEGHLPEPADLDLAAARAVVVDALVDAPDGGVLVLDAAVALVEALGIRVAEQRLVHSAAEAAQAAGDIGGPVALKARRRSPTAKTERAGVALDRHGPEAAAASYERMAEAFGDAALTVTVQAMLPPGGDARVCLEPAPIVGAAIAVGPGGAAGAILGERARSVLPLTDVGAVELVAEAGIADGLGPDGAAAVADVALRIAAAAEAIPELVELTLDPVIVGTDGACATDVHVRVEPERPAPPGGTRRL